MALDYGSTATNIEELQEETRKAKAELRGEEYVPSSSVGYASFGSPAVAEKLASGEARTVSEAVGIVSYEQAGFTVQRQPDGSFTITKEAEQIEQQELTPAQTYLYSGGQVQYNPFTKQYEAAPFVPPSFTQPPPTAPKTILKPYPTHETAETYEPIQITQRDSILGRQFTETGYLDIPPTPLEAGEEVIYKGQPNVFSEWASGVVGFFGYGTEELPTFVDEPFGTTGGIARFVLLPEQQHGQQTLKDQLDLDKLPRMEFFGGTEAAGGAIVGLVSAPIHLLSIPALLTGQTTDLITEYPLSSEFKSGYFVGVAVGEELITAGAAKAAGWLKTKVAVKHYDLEVPIGLQQTRRTYAQKVPAAFDFEKDVKVFFADLKSTRKPVTFIPDQFEFKWLTADVSAPFKIKGYKPSLMSKTLKYGEGFWEAGKGIDLKTVDTFVDFEDLLTVVEDKATHRYLQSKGWLGAYLPESKQILLRTSYDDWLNIKSVGSDIVIDWPLRTTRTDTLRHETIHHLFPELSEEAVIKATKGGFGIPETKETLWPAGLRGQEQTFIADISGIYPDIDIPKFDITDPMLRASGGGKSDVLYDLAQSYKKQKVKVPVKVDTELKLPSFKFDGVDVKTKVTPRYPSYRAGLEYVEEAYIPTFSGFKDISVEDVSIKSTVMIKEPQLKKLTASGRITKRGVKLKPEFAFKQRKKLRLEQESFFESKKDVFSIQAIGQLQQKKSKQTSSQRFRLDTALQQRQRFRQRTTAGLRLRPPPILRLKKSAKPRRLTLPKLKFKVGKFKVKSKKRRKKLPYADILSVTRTKGTFLAKGKKIRATHPRSKTVLWREFKGRAGLRVPTVEMLKGRKGRKKEKWF